MDNKKEIIINEIHYWRQNKLIPEQYCDFLLALYTEGDVTTKVKPVKTNPFHIVRMIVSFLLFLVAVLLYFTELSFSLQITLFIGLLLAQLGIALWSFRKRSFYIFPFLLALLIFMLASVQLVTHFFPGKPSSLLALLFFHCLLWFYLGRKIKFLPLTIASILGVIWIIINIFN